MGLESSDVVRFDIGPLRQGQMLTFKLKSAYNLTRLLLVIEVCNVKPTYRKTIGWESSDVVKFDLGPLLQGQTRTAKLKRANNLLIIDPRGLQCETNV